MLDITEEKAHYVYYSLMRVKYTLIKMQKEGEMDIYLGPEADSNKAVSAKEVARFSRGIAVKEIDEFEKLYEFEIGKELTPDLTNIAEWNEQDELNGNWITTWYKINPKKPENSDRVTLISFRFMLEEPGDWGIWVYYCIYYDYGTQWIYWWDYNEDPIGIWDYTYYDQYTWNSLSVLLRKVKVNGKLTFKVLAGTNFDDKNKTMIIPRDREDLSNEEMRKIKEEEDREYNSDEAKAKRRAEKEENTEFLVQRQAPELLSKTGMFIKKGQPVNCAFGVKKFGDTKSDFNGVMLGPVFYSEILDPVINTKVIFYFANNPLKASGRVQNGAKNVPGSNGRFVYWSVKHERWMYFYDDITCGIGPTYIQANIPAKGDSPFGQNTIMSGGVELATNKDTWKLMNKDGGKHKVSLFELNNGKDNYGEAAAASATKGPKTRKALPLMKLVHRIDAPPSSAAIYKTKSTVEVMILKEVESDGEGAYETVKTKQFSIEDSPIETYQFQYSTALKQHYYKKSEEFDKEDYDMIVRYKDNKGTNLVINAKSAIFSSVEQYGLLLGETFEKMQPKLPLYNHKWISFSLSTASNGYDKITKAPEDDEDDFEGDEEKSVMSQDEFTDLIEQYDEDITIWIEYIWEWISYYEINWKLIVKMKAAKEDEALVDLEEKDKNIKKKLQKYKIELAEKRLEKAGKLLIMATDLDVQQASL